MGTERVIKRYTNRKLYDTDQSRYVTLDDIAKLIRQNEEVRVIDNETQDDLTAVTFAQIILEEEKKKTNLVSVPFLRKLIHSGEAAVQDFSDSARRAFDQIGDLTGRVVEEGGKAVEEGRSYLDELLNLPQRRLENLREAAREQMDRIRQNPALQREIERLEKSIHSIEQMLSQLRSADEARAQNGNGNGHASASGADEDAPGEVLDPAVAPEIEDELDQEHETRATGGGRSRG